MDAATVRLDGTTTTREAERVLSDVRTCARCGERTAFLVETDGGWAACLSCGRYA